MTPPNPDDIAEWIASAPILTADEIAHVNPDEFALVLASHEALRARIEGWDDEYALVERLKRRIEELEGALTARLEQVGWTNGSKVHNNEASARRFGDEPVYRLVAVVPDPRPKMPRTADWDSPQPMAAAVPDPTEPDRVVTGNDYNAFWPPAAAVPDPTETP